MSRPRTVPESEEAGARTPARPRPIRSPSRPLWESRPGPRTSRQPVGPPPPVVEVPVHPLARAQVRPLHKPVPSRPSRARRAPSRPRRRRYSAQRLRPPLRERAASPARGCHRSRLSGSSSSSNNNNSHRLLPPRRRRRLRVGPSRRRRRSRPLAARGQLRGRSRCSNSNNESQLLLRQRQEVVVRVRVPARRPRRGRADPVRRRQRAGPTRSRSRAGPARVPVRTPVSSRHRLRRRPPR